jgi:lysophospholipase L1-like esterase
LDLTRPDESDIDRRRYSNSVLWITLICGILLTVILLELLCLASLYVYDSLKGRDNYWFAREHILTRPFASIPAGPVPGKLFLGHLRSIYARGWDQFLPHDGLLGWHLAPNISAYYADNPESSEDLIVTDENGFSSDVNDPPVALQKSINSYRVIVLGGSTVMGQGSQQPSLNIVGMLRKGVRVRGLTGPNGKSVEFINAGVDGYTSTQEYLYFGSDLLRFKPDLVIVYDGWNDIDIKNFGPTLFRTLAERQITEQAEQSSSIAGSARLLARNLRISATEGDLRVGMIELPWRVFKKLTYVEGAPHTVSPFDPRSLEYYRINHQAFLALADDQLSVAIFLQPLVGVDGRELSNEEKTSWWYRLPQFDDKLRARVPFYEGARSVLADLKERAHNNIHVCIADISRSVNGINEPIYADSGHLLPKGNEVVASHILDRLVSCGLLQQGFATLN